MTPSRPYLIRALYEWIVDNGLTPHILVNAEYAGVVVPTQYIHEGRIVLNITPSAISHLQLGNDLIEFSARFSGASHAIRIPPRAVLAVYARENGQGMAFGDEPGGSEPPPDEPPPDKKPAEKKPTLKVIK